VRADDDVRALADLGGVSELLAGLGGDLDGDGDAIVGSELLGVLGQDRRAVGVGPDDQVGVRTGRVLGVDGGGSGGGRGRGGVGGRDSDELAAALALEVEDVDVLSPLLPQPARTRAATPVRAAAPRARLCIDSPKWIAGSNRCVPAEVRAPYTLLASNLPGSSARDFRRLQNVSDS
jgi:hypothetical protein